MGEPLPARGYETNACSTPPHFSARGARYSPPSARRWHMSVTGVLDTHHQRLKKSAAVDRHKEPDLGLPGRRNTYRPRCQQKILGAECSI